MSEFLPIKKIFNFEKGSLQSTKCTPGAYTFVTAGTEWKTHNEFTHETEALILAVAASGSLGRCHYIKDKFIASDLCFILTPKDIELYPIDLEFYHQIFRSIRSDLVQKTATGTSKLSINRTNFGNYKIPYFDIVHQQIFKKILLNANNKKDKLLINNKNQQNLIELLKKQILQDAISGKLTADWRTKNSDIEPASKLLEQIKAEKEKMIAEKKIKKEKLLPKIKEDEVPFELPEKWEWCRLFDCGITNPRNHLNDELDVSFIPMPLISSKFNKAPDFEIRKWKNVKSGFTHFAEDDVAVAKITPCFENSKACIFKNIKNKYGAGTTELHVFRPIKNTILSSYIYINLKTSNFLKDGERNMRGVAGQKRVPSDYFKLFCIPLPPLEEQKVIVAKIEKLIEQVSKIEEKIQQDRRNAEILMQSFLVEAFK